MRRGPLSVERPTVTSDGQTLIIAGDAIPVESRRIPLDDVVLDPSNPRIQHAVRQSGRKEPISQAELRRIILDRPGVDQLFKSIRENGGLIEPIYVRPDGRVIEGNCRAASFMKLRDANRRDARWQTIPALFVPTISDRQVAVLQGQYHIAGKNKWLAYEKAGHLHFMRTQLGMEPKDIGIALSMTEREIITQLSAYDTMTKKLLPKMQGANGTEKWSFVEEFYKRKDLETYRSTPANVDSFVKMVVSGRIKKGADVRKLPDILKHPSAVTVLKKQGVDAAIAVVGKKDPTADSAAFRKLKQTTRVLKRLPAKELQRLRTEGQERVILAELFAAVKDVAKLAGVKLG